MPGAPGCGNFSLGPLPATALGSHGLAWGVVAAETGYPWASTKAPVETLLQ